MIHIYDAKGNFKDSLNYSKEEFLPTWYSGYQKGDYISEIKFEHPIVDQDIIREMTREEQIVLLNNLDLLQDGEVFEMGKIKKVECPAGIIRGAWDKEKHIWIETMKKEELMNIRKEKILKYAELKKEIETLEEFQDEFESDNTIEMLKKEMEDLKKEINDLYKKIKSL